MPLPGPPPGVVVVNWIAMSDSVHEEEERRQRAEARRLRMTVERIDATAPAPFDDGRSFEDRLADMTALCRAAWAVSGTEPTRLPRSQWPGAVFRILHAPAERASR
jgi:hypothetical protein